MPKIKNIIIFMAIAGAFFSIYIFFIKPSPEQASLVSSGTGAALPNMDGSSANTYPSNKKSLITKDFLTLFSSVKNIKLNDAILSDPAFTSLRDSSITLTPDGTEGRKNPFAQFDSGSSAQPAVSAPTAPVSARH